MSQDTNRRILLIADEPGAEDEFRKALCLGDPAARAARAADTVPLAEPALQRLVAPETLRAVQVDSVRQGAEGLDRLRRAIWEHRPYALAVIDLNSPQPWDGAGTAQRLWEITADLPVLLGTRGEPAAELARRLHSRDHVVFLPDPWDAAAIRQLVAAQLDRRLMRDELHRMQTDLDATRRALERMREEAEEAERFKQQFVCNISHEIRTPMNAILGFSRLLMKEPLTAGQMEKARYVHDAGNSLMHLIENVLDFSKLSSGKLTLDVAGFHLDDVIREVLDATRPIARDKGLAILCHTEEAAPRWLQGDMGRLRQVLINLVDNAVKFTECGTVHLRTTVDEEGESTVALRVVITDSGVGIPPDRQAMIFEAFSQVDGSTTRQFGGIGLGLSICKRLVDLMGGQIGFRSAPGQGSSFWFTVTFRKSEPPHGALPAPTTAAEFGSSPVSAPGKPLEGQPGQQVPQGRILVADDDRLDRLLLEALLIRTGCIVDLVGNGREALAVLRSNHYDLVFMDINMPELDGLEAMRRVRQEETGAGRHVSIVALTANAEPSDREQCLAAGADDYLAKPFTAEALLGAVQHYLPGLLESSRWEQPAELEGGPVEPSLLADSLADRVSGLRGALEQSDFDALEIRAHAVKNLAARAGSDAVADHAMRVQLAARRRDLHGASAAVERLGRALQDWSAPQRETPFHSCQ